MARSRILKPSFFTNDKLAELPPTARLLFQGLWLIADREGRLEDRPKRIKGELFPYDTVPVDRFLNDLAERGFISRYESGGNRYIAILAFKKHQSPHVKEPASTIPAPDEHQTSTVLDDVPDSASTGSRAGALFQFQDPDSLSVSDPVSLSDPRASGPEERETAREALPVAVREMSAAIQSWLGRFGYDESTIEECDLFAKDFTGQWDELNFARAEVLRDGKKPFPGNLRKYMPGANGAKRNAAEPERFGAGSDMVDRYNAALKVVVASGKAPNVLKAKEVLPYREWLEAQYGEVTA